MASSRLKMWVDRFETLPRPVRVAALLTVHLLIFSAAYWMAFLFRFDFQIPAEFYGPFWMSLGALLVVKTAVFGVLKMFQGWWKYVSLYDVIGLAHALAVSSLVFMAVNTLVVSPEVFPRSIYLLDFTMSLVFLAGARGGLRLVREAMAAGASAHRPQNLLIVGAGDLGDLLVREITRAEKLRYHPVAFLDDDPYKKGLRLHGIPVEGPLSELPRVVEERQVEEIIIALAPDEQENVRRVVDLATSMDIQPRILPTMETVLDGEISLRQVREVSITDLLGREAVELDIKALGHFLEDRVVLVTGAGGSIGSELCRQIARFSPTRLVMVDCAETPLFDIHRELRPRQAAKISPVIGDVADARRMEDIFARFKPEVVLHAAAYKHVPMMEANPSEAVKNNVGGTRVVADLSARFGVQTFVLISTDKAVNPTSVMGATKRITELYLHRLQAREPRTRFCAVRFGNVLGSNGSVVPIFREQIRKGGPVTVTHPEMTRYFMTIPEAVQLVLQAAAFDTDDTLFILDMGSPVRIADLARDMIRLSGMTEEEIAIVYSGVRPGEKLYEELTLAQESVDRTAHPKIFVGQSPANPPAEFDTLFFALIQAAEAYENWQVRRILGHLIPGYSTEDFEDPAVDEQMLRISR